MRPRDRAALVLALCCLRAAKCISVQTEDALRLGGPVSNAIYMIVFRHIVWEERVHRARLALLLRALLRADAGDFGPARLTAAGRAYLALSAAEMIVHGGFASRMGATDTRCITPLWEHAPKRASRLALARIRPTSPAVGT